MKETVVKIQEKWKTEYSYSMIITFLIGLLTHLYKFANNLPNHDSLHNYYSNQNVLASGRWFLSFACGFSSYYDLPWINGVISLLFIGLTVVVLLRLFDIKNKMLIILINGLFITFPGITETFFFEFTADGYMMAMFLSSLSVFFLVKCIENKKKTISIILSSALLCLSCGIYQAYVSFALVLFICYFIWIVLKYNYEKKVYICYVVSMFLSLVIGLIVYYIIWKICMIAQGVQADDYQGISQVGSLNINTIISAPKSIAKDLGALVLEKNVLKYGLSLYAVFNILFIAFSVIIWLFAIVKSKVYQSVFKLVSIGICIFVLPFVICIWRFTSSEVIYGQRMLNCVIILYVFSLFLCSNYIKSNIYKLSVNFLVIATVFNLFIQANIAYYYLNYMYEKTYSEAIYLYSELNDSLIEYGKNHKIAIIGNREDDVALDQDSEANGSYLYTNIIQKSLLTDEKHIKNYLKNVLYFDGDFADSDAMKKIELTESYAEMKPFFEYGDVKIINDVITIKLG